jgi:hypothetical protein
MKSLKKKINKFKNIYQKGKKKKYVFLGKYKKKKKLRCPGVDPGSPRWQREILTDILTPNSW